MIYCRRLRKFKEKRKNMYFNTNKKLRNCVQSLKCVECYLIGQSYRCEVIEIL